MIATARPAAMKALLRKTGPNGDLEFLPIRISESMVYKNGDEIPLPEPLELTTVALTCPH